MIQNNVMKYKMYGMTRWGSKSFHIPYEHVTSEVQSISIQKQHLMYDNQLERVFQVKYVLINSHHLCMIVVLDLQIIRCAIE